MSQIEPPWRIQRISIAAYLSYQPVIYSNSTYPHVQSQRWKCHHPTGTHLAVALESNGFFDTLGYGAYPNRIFWRIFVFKSWGQVHIQLLPKYEPISRNIDDMVPLNVICTCMAMCTCRATEHGKWNNITYTDRYGFILRQELGVDPTSTSGYEDTPKDTIWIRQVSESSKKCPIFWRPAHP